jgi:large subunit ribosomal protein L30
MDLPHIKIQQIGSPIRRHGSQRATLVGLGLNRIGRISEVPYTRQTMGMIEKVKHLVRFVDEDLYEEHRLVQPRKEDEAADAKIMRDLVFAKPGVFFAQIQTQGDARPNAGLQTGPRRKNTRLLRAKITEG